MSKAKKLPIRKDPAPAPMKEHRLIAEQTAAFLAKGHKIQKIPRGVSGQTNLGGPALQTTEGGSAKSRS